MRTSNYIFYLVVIAALSAGIASCKKNNTPTSFVTNKTALQAAIDSLTNVYNNAKEGSKPGDYAVGAKGALDTAILLAKQVAASQSYTQQQVNNTLNSLLKAGQQFSGQLLQEVSV